MHQDWRAACLSSICRECYGYDKSGQLIIIHFTLFGPPVVEVPGRTKEEEPWVLARALNACSGWSPVLASLQHFVN